MQQCLIYNNSLRFSRAIYGLLTIIAFLIHNHWLVLATAILMTLGTCSIKLNIPYQLHVLFLKKFKKEVQPPIEKELAELNFVSGMTAGLLLIGFLFIYFDKFVEFAWIYILIVALLIFLACFVGFCVATLMYVFFKKIFMR